MQALEMIRGEMRTFFVVWFGQVISIIGSSMTAFALGVYVYLETGLVTSFALVLLFTTLPGIFLAPMAGSVVDQWDRRRVMIISDTLAGLSSAAIAVLLFTDSMELWHIYIAVAVNSAANTFQWPAYMAATAQLVPKEQMGRASGLIQMAQAIGQLAGPALAGLLFLAIGLSGILLIDFATFLIAVGTLLFVRFPEVERTAAGKAAEGSLYRRAVAGWTYVAARSGLVWLLVFASLFNFFLELSYVLVLPMVLNFAEADQLGFLLFFGGLSMMIGSGIMTAWGGTRRKVHGLLGFAALLGVGLIIAGSRPNIWVFFVGSNLIFLCLPLVAASSTAIWLRKVEPDLQGRVAAVRRMISLALPALAYIIAGPLADNVVEPLMVEGGSLAGSVGGLIGVGAGRGIGLIMISMGSLQILSSLFGYLNPRLRLVEVELPDGTTDKEADEAEVVPDVEVAPETATSD